jgi:hypothetical protein
MIRATKLSPGGSQKRSVLRWAALAVLSLFCDIGIGRRPAATVDFVWLLPGGPHNKNQEIIAASNRALEGSSSSSEAPLALLRLRFDLLKAGSLAIHRFHVFGQCPPLLARSRYNRRTLSSLLWRAACSHSTAFSRHACARSFILRNPKLACSECGRIRS